MNRSKPKSEKISVPDLLQRLPQDYLDELATELFVDKWVRKLPASALFKLVLFSLLSGKRLSLRTMEDHSVDPLFQTMAATMSADEVSWVGIRQRLTRLKVTYCQRLYDKVYEQQGDLCPDEHFVLHHRYFERRVYGCFHLRHCPFAATPA